MEFHIPEGAADVFYRKAYFIHFALGNGVVDLSVSLDSVYCRLQLGECVADSSQENDLAEAFALRHALKEFLRSLDPKTRIIFLQRYFYVCPVADIADRHGMKESTVTMLLFRTRKKLKEHLMKEGINL